MMPKLTCYRNTVCLYLLRNTSPIHVILVIVVVVSFSNSLPASFNLSYDHGDYRERVDHNKDFFEKMQLKQLYQDKSLTGGF